MEIYSAAPGISEGFAVLAALLPGTPGLPARPAPLLAAPPPGPRPNPGHQRGRPRPRRASTQNPTGLSSWAPPAPRQTDPDSQPVHRSQSCTTVYFGLGALEDKAGDLLVTLLLNGSARLAPRRPAAGSGNDLECGCHGQ